MVKYENKSNQGSILDEYVFDIITGAWVSVIEYESFLETLNEEETNKFLFIETKTNKMKNDE